MGEPSNGNTTVVHIPPMVHACEQQLMERCRYTPKGHFVDRGKAREFCEEKYYSDEYIGGHKLTTEYNNGINYVNRLIEDFGLIATCSRIWVPQPKPSPVEVQQPETDFSIVPYAVAGGLVIVGLLLFASGMGEVATGAAVARAALATAAF